MLWYQIKMAFRALKKNRVFSLVNIIGLSVAMAVGVLVVLFVHHERTMDAFHERAGDIYRIEVGEVALSPTFFSHTIGQKIPEVEATTMICTLWPSNLLQAEGDPLRADVYYADSAFFQVFSFGWIAGDPATALAGQGSVVLTRSMAEKLFGKEDPVGKTLVVNTAMTYTVTGLIEDPPLRSSMQFDALLSLVSMARREYLQSFMTNRSTFNYNTFLLLRPGTDIRSFEPRIAEFLNEEMNATATNPKDWELSLRGLRDIYMAEGVRFDFVEHGNAGMVRVFLIVGILVLLIAMINFINISRAHWQTRQKATGLKMVLGIQRANLVRGFLSESTLLCLAAFVIGLFLAEQFLPDYRVLVSRELSLASLNLPLAWLIGLGFVLLTGLLSGLYPSLFATRLNPAEAIKGGRNLGGGRNIFRKLLITFQFVATISLLAGTFIIHEQTRFMRRFDMGYDPSRLVTLPTTQNQPFLEELRHLPGVAHVFTTNSLPGTTGMEWTRDIEGEQRRFRVIVTTPEFTQALNLNILRGRNFSEDLQTDFGATFLVNESGARYLGLEDPTGIQIGSEGSVIGVVEDFHFLSAHSPLQPTLLAYGNQSPARHVNISLGPGDMGRILEQVQELWLSHSPDMPFEYHFWDDSIDSLYAGEKRLNKTFFILSGISVLVACLGLWGLASFVMVQRTREIGIRKVLGESRGSILGSLYREYALLVGAAFVLSLPVIWLSMSRWLESFHYRIQIGWQPFLLSLVTTLLVAMAAVTYHSLRVAATNPVEALRSE